MINRLKAGDSVVTSGGLHGMITGVTDQTVVVRIAENVEVEVSRASVSHLKSKSEPASS